ncbi:Uma2 family endonuclease [Nonomuraea jiangxiensis]|uniref:Endonuclease, Uma2 family (Restriction endonuclease fold) n=1 Tax=Nonomuraea jiangxiensis TaxID=633440 RepID=A0A1G9U699_9ACTN|nr:Uma2 family endonuclease [Nonomuraea jiangxiensis]SDM55194.1 Endonuclease, Uma2 family (restriction endonuclease fold) [Nonomuraea jiangxiensis]
MTTTAGRRPPRTARDLWESLVDLDLFRVQVLDGRLIAHRNDPPEHAFRVAALAGALFQSCFARGWQVATNSAAVCMAGTRDPVVPDLVLSPADCPLWRGTELLSSGVVLLAEVVSDQTAHDDREVKPHVYARGGVPVYLLIDPLDDPPSVTVFSGSGGAYQSVTRVLMGEPIRLPQPIDLELDTSLFNELRRAGKAAH